MPLQKRTVPTPWKALVWQGKLHGRGGLPPSIPVGGAFDACLPRRSCGRPGRRLGQADRNREGPGHEVVLKEYDQGHGGRVALAVARGGLLGCFREIEHGVFDVGEVVGLGSNWL